jgi:hypothetical protein
MSPVDVAALAQSAIAGVMRVVSRCGRTIGDSQQLEDVAALTASIPVEFQTSIVLAHNTDALADSLPYVDALSIFFKDQQTTHCGHAVFVNCAKNLYVHREASGVWRCGRGIGSAETLCFTSGAGGSLPPCQGWVDSHGEPITDLVCLNPHLWSALSVRKLQLGDATRATTSATTVPRPVPRPAGQIAPPPQVAPLPATSKAVVPPARGSICEVADVAVPLAPSPPLEPPPLRIPRDKRMPAPPSRPPPASAYKVDDEDEEWDDPSRDQSHDHSWQHGKWRDQSSWQQGTWHDQSRDQSHDQSHDHDDAATPIDRVTLITRAANCTLKYIIMCCCLLQLVMNSVRFE